MVWFILFNSIYIDDSQLCDYSLEWDDKIFNNPLSLKYPPESLPLSITPSFLSHSYVPNDDPSSPLLNLSGTRIVRLFIVLDINSTTSLLENNTAQRRLTSLCHPNKWNSSKKITLKENIDVFKTTYNVYKHLK